MVRNRVGGRGRIYKTDPLGDVKFRWMLGFRTIVIPWYIQLFRNIEASGKCDQLLFPNY